MTLAGMQIGVRTRVHIPIFALHRNVRLWDNPTAFDPIVSPRTRLRRAHVYAFLPFGGGPRVCIGASFATIEAAVILAVLARTFRFLPVAGHLTFRDRFLGYQSKTRTVAGANFAGRNLPLPL
jgi:cytochrome P450